MVKSFSTQWELIITLFLLKAEGIFRINADNSQEVYVREQLSSGVVPHRIDVHCLAGLLKVFINFWGFVV